MSKENNGGPAFPRPVSDGEHGQSPSQEGMSLRDWFAGLAMQRLITEINFGSHPDNDTNPFHEDYFSTESTASLNRTYLSETAYKIADEMIYRREQ